MRFSCSVSGINWGTGLGLLYGSNATKVKYASLLSYWYCCKRSSPQTCKCISIEVVKALETFASICTTLPSLIGVLKLRLSTLAVILGKLQCFPAAMPAAISIQYISLPPIKFPKVLVSFGSTISFIIIKLSLAFFSFIPLICAKVLVCIF